MVLSLLQILGGFLTGILVTLITIRGQARLSERTYKHDLERDTVAFRRQRTAQSRDWHAEQFATVLEATKLYELCLRRVDGPEDLHSKGIHDDRAHAEKLITQATHALSREPGNLAVTVLCKMFRLSFDLYVLYVETGEIQMGESASGSRDESDDAKDDVADDGDYDNNIAAEMQTRLSEIIRTLQSAIQKRLSELDSQMK